MRDLILRTLASRKAMTSIAGVVAALAAHFGLEVDPQEIAVGLAFLGTLLIGQSVSDAGKHAPMGPPDTFGGALSFMLGNLLTSSKHMATLTGFIVAGTAHYGYEADPDVVVSILSIIGVYVVGKGVSNAGRAHAARLERLIEEPIELEPEPEPEAVPVTRPRPRVKVKL